MGAFGTLGYAYYHADQRVLELLEVGLIFSSTAPINLLRSGSLRCKTYSRCMFAECFRAVLLFPRLQQKKEALRQIRQGSSSEGGSDEE